MRSRGRISLTIIGLGWVGILAFAVLPSARASDGVLTTGTAPRGVPQPADANALLLATCPFSLLPGGGSAFDGPYAPHSNWRFIRAHYLITEAEMAASGFYAGTSPVAIGWTYRVGSGVSANGSLKIYLQNTTDKTNIKSATWTTAIADMTLVRNASTTLPAVSGPFDIPISGGAFTYTGGGVYVAFDWQWAGPRTTTAVVEGLSSLPGGLKGRDDNSSPPSTLVTSNFRPETRFISNDALTNDVRVTQIRALGVLPTPLVGPQFFSAVVKNLGTWAQSNVPVTMNIMGADSFVDVATVGALPACGGSAEVTFAAFTPAALGSSSISVSVPPDDFPGNDVVTTPMEETNNRFSYKHPGTMGWGGFELNDDLHTVAGAFSTDRAAKVSQVELEFFAATATRYRVVIYGDDGGRPATTALYVDAVDRAVGAAGLAVVTLPTPVAVGPGRFYVGLRQTSTIDVSLSFDAEIPVRDNTFFRTTKAQPDNWLDFGWFFPTYWIKPNIGIKLIQCAADPECTDANVCTDDACVSEVCAYTNNTSPCEDGNSSTGPDVCAGGVCTPGPNPCDDNDACTNDISDGIGGCSYTPVMCNDDSPCTSDSCNTGTGCVFAPISGPACSDGDFCTIGDQCDNGVCIPGSLPDPIVICNSGAITIPAFGTSGPASPYPATLNFSGGSTVCKATVQLNGVFHSEPSDIDILLESPSGRNAIIMARIGGFAAIPPPGVYLGLDDAAASYIPIPLETGTFKPTNANSDGNPPVAFPAPAPIPNGGSALSIFNRTASDGAWKLWINDHVTGQTGGIDAGWCISIAAAPCQVNADCDDSDDCNGIETCNAGRCQDGTPVICDDGLFCTLDSCNPSDGSCVFAPHPCDDGDRCTADSCNEGANACAHTNVCAQFCSTGSISVPSTSGAPASPYPSTITVSGVLAPAEVVSVELLGVVQTASDLEILLDGPAPGLSVLLMSDAGGNSVSGLNVKFMDGAPEIPYAGPLLSGPYSPTDYEDDLDFFPAPAPTWSGSLSLASFTGNVSGQFKLYVRDDSTIGPNGSINQWCVNILHECVDASQCDDGISCTMDICNAKGTCDHTPHNAACPCNGTWTPNPKTKGHYRKLCNHNELTAEQAACVAQAAPMTFGATDAVEEICDELNGQGDVPGDDSDEMHCTEDETELLVLALNVCTGRVCSSQPIDPQHSGNTTVQESLDEADQIFGDPARDEESCHDGKELVREINNGEALGMNTLMLTKAGNGLVLSWTPPYAGSGQTIVGYEIWRSPAGGDAFTKIHTGMATSYVDNVNGDFDYEVLVEMQN